jgi:hypothetical protein
VAVAAVGGAGACIGPRPQASSTTAARAQVSESGPALSEAPVPVATETPDDRGTRQCPTLYLSRERLEKEVDLLERARKAHARAMQAYDEGDCRHIAPPAFGTVMKLATRHGRLYECQRGGWVYRDTELVHLYATACFYSALCSIRIGDYPGFPSDDELLCTAFHAAPQLISQVQVPSDLADRVAAVRERCIVPGGWRSDRIPAYGAAATGR